MSAATLTRALDAEAVEDLAASAMLWQAMLDAPAAALRQMVLDPQVSAHARGIAAATILSRAVAAGTPPRRLIGGREPLVVCPGCAGTVYRLPTATRPGFCTDCA